VISEIGSTRYILLPRARERSSETCNGSEFGSQTEAFRLALEMERTIRLLLSRNSTLLVLRVLRLAFFLSRSLRDGIDGLALLILWLIRGNKLRL
jgi:hypothetical protein